MTEPCDLPAVTARALIGERKLSPVELMDSCIRRIEEIDPAVNAVIARSFETARAAQASEAAVMRGDILGALHGLPLGVKDLIDAKGLPTSFGSVLFGQYRGRG
jgi:Asp-tRNAAsn/Glu-tRNAGln amidotransferase A subunit and related amidases